VNRQRTLPRDTLKRGISVVLGQFGDLIGRGLIQVLQEDEQISVIARDLDLHALERTVAHRVPLVAVLEEGSASLRQLKALTRSTSIVVLAHKPSARRRETLEASGATCLSTQATTRELLTTIRLGAGNRVTPLTTREQEILGHVRTGRTAQEIADELQISVHTVRTHIATILQKLGVKSKRDLIATPSAKLKRQ
jgi:DNA-binding NarL/FixJ family response regulator